MARIPLKYLIVLLKTNRTNTYATATALTFCLYDIMLSLNDEIKYIWGAKRSPITVLYLIVRYYSVIAFVTTIILITSPGISVKACQGYFWWTVAGVPSVFVLALDTILLLRVFALYKHDKRVFAVLLLLVIGNFASSQWASTTLASRLAKTAIPIPHPWHGCISPPPKQGFNIMLASYVPTFALSLVFLGMTLKKLVECYQDVHGRLAWKSVNNVYGLSPLLLAFVRDGSIFFALTCCISFLSILSLYVVQGPMLAAFYPWTLALYSYSGSHLVLDLRAAATKRSSRIWNKTLSPEFRSDGFSSKSIEFA